MPAIAWLGGPPPRGVAESLSDIAALQTEWTPDVQLIAVWAPAGVDQLRKLPRRTQRPPVLAALNRDPTHAERMAWIRAGAEDLVSLAALPLAVARRLQGGDATDSLQGDSASSPDHASSSGQTPEGFRRRNPTSLVMPHRLADDASQRPVALGPRGGASDASSLGGGSSASGRLSKRNDAFPPLRVPQPDGVVPLTVVPWVRALRRYLKARDVWLERFGPGAIDKLLELSHLRAEVPSAASPELALNTFGQAHGTGRDPLGWPMLVRRGPARGGRIEVQEAEVAHAGTDGMVVAVPFEATERQKLVADITVDERRNAQFLLEARWQRRLTARRWSLGLIIVEMRLRNLPD